MKTQILLSAYNGEKYIMDQLNSLLLQDHQDINILIRDDGSTDYTVDIISRIIGENKAVINLYIGKNIGVVSSFFDLLENSSDECLFYAFCDQDDYWGSNKLIQALEKISDISPDVPTMYCSNTKLVDSKLEKILGSFPPEPVRGVGLSNALVQNVAVGCTIVINRAARDLLLRKRVDLKNIIMHDWWIYLCISAFGKVIYDDQAYVLYRQHDNNVIGGRRKIISRIINVLRRFVKNGNNQQLKNQAKELYNMFADELSLEAKQRIERFIENKTIIARIKYSFSGEVYRHSKIGNVLLRMLIILNRY